LNWVDLAVIAVVAVSALLAFVRGFVREALGIGAWVGAAIVAWWAYPNLLPQMHAWIDNPDLEAPAAFILIFVGALILFSIVAGMAGGLVRMSLLASIDRLLGFVFGVLRGAAIVVVAYIGLGLVVPPDRWPPVLQQARSLPYAYDGAVWVTQRLPQNFRPKVPAPAAIQPASAPAAPASDTPAPETPAPDSAPPSHSEDLLPKLRSGTAPTQQ
jgi:membrane protein required for colicin V production